MKNNRLVTIAIPAYNECKYIEGVVRGFLSQNHPDLLEIIVADGGSDDGTQEIVKKITLEDSRVILLNNALRNQAAGLNLIVKKCRGDIFLRADAHSEYAPDYIEECVKTLEFSQALNVGGSQRHVAKNTFQGGVALAFRSFLAGTAKFHDPNYNGYSDTVYLGCFVKKYLLQIAQDNPENEIFKTKHVPNEDAGLNMMLLEISDKGIYISSKIKVWYYPRDNWRKLIIQYFKYGRGRALTTLDKPNIAPLRTKAPMLLLILYLFTLVLSLYFGYGLFFLIVSLLAIVGGLFLESIRVFYCYYPSFSDEVWRGETDKQPNPVLLFFSCFIALGIMPTSYLLGNLYQRYRNKIRGIDGW